MSGQISWLTPTATLANRIATFLQIILRMCHISQEDICHEDISQQDTPRLQPGISLTPSAVPLTHNWIEHQHIATWEHLETQSNYTGNIMRILGYLALLQLLHDASNTYRTPSAARQNMSLILIISIETVSLCYLPPRQPKHTD